MVGGPLLTVPRTRKYFFVESVPFVMGVRRRFTVFLLVLYFSYCLVYGVDKEV